ncbi:MAG: hypothetical protein AAGG38_07680 [Planctomycetota bacterium]
MPTDFDSYRKFAEATDRRAAFLIEEFREHKAEVLEQFRADGKPEPDPQKIFEAWVIQKLAGLQIMVKGEDIDDGYEPPDRSG